MLRGLMCITPDPSTLQVNLAHMATVQLWLSATYRCGVMRKQECPTGGENKDSAGGEGNSKLMREPTSINCINITTHHVAISITL